MNISSIHQIFLDKFKALYKYISVLDIKLVMSMWSCSLLALILMNVSGNQTIGAVAWGPTSDIRSIAVAISDLRFGLKGGIAYRAVVNKLADNISSTKSDINVNDELTRDLCQDPKIVDKAIKSAVGLNKNELPPDYVRVIAEDIGQAYYYKLAFQIFGYNALSPYLLYMAIVVFTTAIFLIQYSGSIPSLAILCTFFCSSYLITSVPGFFNPGLPSLASGRLLYSIGFGPFLHVLLGLLCRKEMYFRDIIYIFIQSIILGFSIRSRITGQWMIICMGLIPFALFFTRKISLKSLVVGIYESIIFPLTCTKEFNLRTSINLYQKIADANSKFISRAFTICLIISLTYVAMIKLEEIKIDSSYFTDDYLPHHLVWHSAFIGLAASPGWSEHKPLADLPNVISDGIAFKVFENYMTQRGLSFVSPEGLHKMRLHDQIIKTEFLKFIINKPIYTLQLYAFYKPQDIVMKFFSLMINVFRSFQIIIALVTIIICMYALREYSINGSYKDCITVLIVIVFCSLMPMLWAYCGTYDSLWAAVFIFQILVTYVILVLYKKIIFLKFQ